MVDFTDVVSIMKNKTLLYANFKRHKGVMLGIFSIIMVVSLSIVSVISVWLNANLYLKEEMNRMNYGDLTVWTRSLDNEESLYFEIEQLSDVEANSVQSLIFADYEFSGQQSDSEGQLIVYEPDHFPYRIFNSSNTAYINENIVISPGEIYISPSLLSTFDMQINDVITIPIDRNGNSKAFKIKGMFEDPFMGSSMIGMKSFLISQSDFDEINALIKEAGINALAREGKMLHIKQSSESSLNNAQFNQLLNEQTALSDYVEFAHSQDAISGFMLILQNAFAGLSLAFAVVLMILSMIIISYSLGSMIDQDETNMAILKTVGYDGSKLRSILILQYLICIDLGAVLGIILSLLSVPFICKSMVSFAGILTPSTPLIALWLLLILLLTVFYALFIHIKTIRINSIPPINIMQKDKGKKKQTEKIFIQKRFLMFWLSMRQLMSEKKRYISVFMTAVLLVFITSMVGRMNAWLGPDGKGLMDAFNPSDLDIGIQLIGNQDIEEMETTIQQYSLIADTYELAMPNVSINGIDVTANVISEPERFHIQQGTTSLNDDEIVITETIADDMELELYEQVNVAYNGYSDTYTVVGIYQCANDMGANIGMNQEGFLRIGSLTQDMQCHHYFLEHPEQKQNLIEALNERYGGDVYIHENTWPGLFSIITAMHLLLTVMYILTALFIFIVTMMTVHKLFLFEKRNLSIYKALGCTGSQLRLTFAIRYGVVAAMGSILGMLISTLSTDSIVGYLMRLYGISNFSSHPELLLIILPCIIVSLLFAGFAYWVSRRSTHLDMNELVSE